MTFKSIDDLGLLSMAKLAEWSYRPAGMTYEIDLEDVRGFRWYYRMEGRYSIAIDRLSFARDFMLQSKVESLYTIVLYVTASGDEFLPYRSLSSDSITLYAPDTPFKVIYHHNIELYALTINIYASFVENFLQERYPTLAGAVQTAFARGPRQRFDLIRPLMYDILQCNESAEVSALLFEARILEILSRITGAQETLAISDAAAERVTIKPEDVTALMEIAEYISDHYNRQISLKTLSSISLMSESKLKTLFKAQYGMTITEYIQKKRMSSAELLLISTDLPLAQISKIVGYANPSRFSELFRRYYGIAPSSYRAGK